MADSLFRAPAPLLAAMVGYAEAAILGRAPDLVIGGADNPYLRRWHLTPRGQGPAVYLHHFLRDDDDRALHDHPWDSIGIILRQGYTEVMPEGTASRVAGDVIFRPALHRHRVVLARDEAGKPIPAWTLFFVGQRVRDWGFWCPGHGGSERFVPWQAFTEGPNGEIVGKGCGE